jgi:hypothetical protein
VEFYCHILVYGNFTLFVFISNRAMNIRNNYDLLVNTNKSAGGAYYTSDVRANNGSQYIIPDINIPDQHKIASLKN